MAAALSLINVSDLCPGQDIREITSLTAASRGFDRLEDLRFACSLLTDLGSSCVELKRLDISKNNIATISEISIELPRKTRQLTLYY